LLINNKCRMDNITVVVIFITAVAITLAITVWFQSVTMAKVFMSHAEILEYHGSYIRYSANGTPVIYASLYNRGTTPIRITEVLVNNVPASYVPAVIQPGSKATIRILCPQLKPGTAVKIVVRSAGGSMAVFIIKA